MGRWVRKVQKPAYLIFEWSPQIQNLPMAMLGIRVDMVESHKKLSSAFVYGRGQSKGMIIHKID